MKSKNKQILKITALYVIWNPKSVKCPASISENPVPLYWSKVKWSFFKFSGLLKKKNFTVLVNILCPLVFIQGCYFVNSTELLIFAHTE